MLDIKYEYRTNIDNLLDELDILDSGYCNKDEWPSEKQRQVDKYTKLGYTDVICRLVKSDTRGLRSWIVYGRKI